MDARNSSGTTPSVTGAAWVPAVTPPLAVTRLKAGLPDSYRMKVSPARVYRITLNSAVVALTAELIALRANPATIEPKKLIGSNSGSVAVVSPCSIRFPAMINSAVVVG